MPAGRGNGMLVVVITSQAILIAVLPPFILIFIGALLRGVKLLKPAHDEPVMHVVFQVLYPCFILDKILGSEALRSGAVVGYSFGIGFSELILGMGVGLLAAKAMRLEKGNGLRTFVFSVGIQNFGYTVIPIVQKLWGDEAVAVLMVHNLGVELSIWTIGVMLMANDGKIVWRKLLNGPAVSVAVGLTLVALGWDKYFTGISREAMRWIGVGAFPLALLITGALMVDMIKVERPTWKVMGGGVIVRLLLIPALLLCAAKYLPVVDHLKKILIVQASMPAAMSPLLVAKLYGGRPGISAQIIVATTAISIFTIPAVILWGMKWVF